MSRECNSCESDCYDIDEYCHRCGDITCDDCLDSEWCPSCLESCEFKVGDFIKIKDGNAAGVVESISTDRATSGWPIMRGIKVNPKFYRKYNGAISVFDGFDAAGFPV